MLAVEVIEETVDVLSVSDNLADVGIVHLDKDRHQFLETRGDLTKTRQGK